MISKPNLMYSRPFKRIRSTLGASLLLITCHSQAATEMLDQVVAIVESDVIMSSELQDRLASVTATLKARDIELPPEDVLVRETLDRLILENIQLQRGRRAGVRISDAQIDSAVARIAAQNKLTPEQFRQRLESEGQTWDGTRQQIRREIIIQRVQAGSLNQQIQIAPQEVDNYLATEEGKLLTQADFHFVHALLPIAPNAPEKEAKAAKKLVDSLYRKISNGANFGATIANAPSDYRFSGGDLGWRKQDDLPSLMADIADDMQAGETAAPIKSASGWHLVHLAEKRGGKLMVKQSKVRHILLKPSEIRTDAQSKKLAKTLKKRLQNGESFADLAREFSDDIGSAQEGGELGWTNPGQMVPAFENAMNSTAKGQISDPIQSQFGWHILEVQDRREQDMTAEAVRRKAENYLYQRKYQEELDAWLQRIRDEAFVDIK